MGNITTIWVIYSIITLLTSSHLESFPAITNSRETILGPLGHHPQPSIGVRGGGRVATHGPLFLLCSIYP